MFYVYQTKQNWMNTIMVKTLSTIFYNKCSIRLGKRRLKHTAHKKRHFQNKQKRGLNIYLN